MPNEKIMGIEDNIQKENKQVVVRISWDFNMVKC